MATVLNTSPVIDRRRGFITINYGVLANGDVGDAFESAGWLLAALEVLGTLGTGGTMKVQGTLDPTGAAASFTALPGWSSTALGMFIPSSGYNTFSRYVRPAVTAGDGTTALSCRIYLVNQSPTG